MAGEELTWSAGVGLVLQDDRLTLDTAASTYTEANAWPVVTPVNDSTMRVRSYTTAPTTAINLMTQEGGLVGGVSPAQMVYREGGTGDWYGHEEPVIKARKVLVSADGVTTDLTKHPHALTRSDGVVAVAYQRELSAVSPAHRLTCGLLDLSGGWTVADIRQHSPSAAPAVDYRPCLVRLDSGRLLCFSWDADTGPELAQIRMDYSDDGGASWSMGKASCLPESISYASGDYSMRAIRGAQGEGGVMLAVHLVDGGDTPSTYRDQIRQYASSDYGYSFREVARTDEEDTTLARRGGGGVEVTVTRAGTFLVSWVASSDQFTYAARVQNAFDGFTDHAPVTIDATNAHATSSGSPSTIANYDQALANAPDGSLYISSRLPTGALDNSHQLHRSDDDGVTWYPVGVGSLLTGDGSTWWRSDNGDITPRSTALVAQDGRLVVLCNHDSPSARFDDSLDALALGGPSNWTLPPFRRFDGNTAQVAWGYTLVPWDDPEDYGLTSTTGAGTSTQNDTDWSFVTTANTIYKTDTLPGTSTTTATRGAIVEFEVEEVSGGVLTSTVIGGTLTVEDLTSSYAVEIRIDSTGYRVYDPNAAAQVGSDVTTLQGAMEIRVAIGDGKVRVYHRPATWTGREAWVLGPAGGLTDGGAGAGTQAVFTWGNVTSGTASSKWYRRCMVWDNYTGSQLLDAYTNPDDLHGRAWPSSPSPIGSGGTLIAADGATARSDEWTVTAESPTGVVQLSSGGTSAGFIAEDTAELTFTYDANGGDDSATQTDVLVVAGFDCNVGHVKVYGVPGTGPDVLLADVDLTTGLKGLPFTISGDTVRPDTGGSDGSTPLAELGEYAGWTFTAYTGGAWKSRRIRRNRGGRWTVEARRRDVLFLEDVDGTEPASGSDGRIIPRDWAVCIDMHGREYEKIKIVYPAPSASVTGPAEAGYQIGRQVVGYLIAHWHQPEWGTRVETSRVGEIFETRDAQRTGTHLGDARRVATLALTTELNGYGVFSKDGDADARWFAVSDHLSADGMGTPAFELRSLEGILRATRGGIDEMVYLASVPRFPAEVTSLLFNRRDELLLCYFDSSVLSEFTAGDDLLDVLSVRGQAFDLVEAR